MQEGPAHERASELEVVDEGAIETVPFEPCALHARLALREEHQRCCELLAIVPEHGIAEVDEAGHHEAPIPLLEVEVLVRHVGVEEDDAAVAKVYARNAGLTLPQKG